MSEVKAHRTYRHGDNPMEKSFHDTFLKEFKNKFHQVALPVERNYSTQEEDKIILSAIQWLGSPVGQSFLNKNGFYFDSDLYYAD